MYVDVDKICYIVTLFEFFGQTTLRRQFWNSIYSTQYNTSRITHNSNITLYNSVDKCRSQASLYKWRFTIFSVSSLTCSLNNYTAFTILCLCQTVLYLCLLLLRRNQGLEIFDAFWCCSVLNSIVIQFIIIICI